MTLENCSDSVSKLEHLAAFIKKFYWLFTNSVFKAFLSFTRRNNAKENILAKNFVEEILV